MQICNRIAIAAPHHKEIHSYTNWLDKYSFNYRILNSDDTIESDEMLMLCGGADFGINKKRDSDELGFIHQAFENHMYILGICRGMQIVNVAMGGTLINDIEHGDIIHTADIIDISGDAPIKESSFHAVKAIHTDCKNEMKVNSRHHQAICRPAPILEIEYVSDDAIIEAASTPAMLLVQWHPEREEVFGTDCEKYVSDWIKLKMKL